MAVGDNTTVAVISEISSSCFTKTGKLSDGYTSEPADSGLIQFPYLEASCYPEGSIKVEYLANVTSPLLFDLDPMPYALKTTGHLTFRNCRNGELLVGNECVVSCINSYALMMLFNLP